ncbi:MAG: hypothetical protein R3C16_03565 [Hyphomonadaceae bacterium]
MRDPAIGRATVQVMAEAPRAKGAKPEEIYRKWLELSAERIGAEQTLLNGYALAAADTGATGERELFAVLAFFDGLAAQVFTRQTDVGELSNYIAADARRWRDLMRGLRQRSTAAAESARYHELTRALAAAEFLASEPITDAERAEFVIENVSAELEEDGRSVEIAADFRTRLRAPKPLPNIAICLRDANGDVCGEAVVAPPVAEANGQRDDLFTATIAASREIANVEVSLTRRAAG